MTERRQINDVAGRALRPYGVWRRLEHSYEPGWPDATYCLLGATGFVECKLVPASGRCPEEFSLDQLIWGASWFRAGGLWHLLGLRAGEWWLLTAPQAREWYDTREPPAAFALRGHTGAFPVRAMLDVLAPKAARHPFSRF